MKLNLTLLESIEMSGRVVEWTMIVQRIYIGHHFGLLCKIFMRQVYSVVSSELCLLAFDINARGVLGVCMFDYASKHISSKTHTQTRPIV